MDLQGVEWWGWLLIGLVLIGAEIVTPGGLFFIFIGMSAIIVGILRAAGLLETGWMQFVSFAVLSMVTLFLFRRPLIKRLGLYGAGRDDIDRLAGETAVALAEVPVDEIGKVELRGTTWNARNTGTRAIALGERCIVDAVNGLTLVVRPERPGSVRPPAPEVAPAEPPVTKESTGDTA